MFQDVISELSDSDTLRVGINLANPLLVTGATSAGEPTGVAPDMAKAVADRLGVALSLVPFASPGEVADAVGDDQWDIAFIGAEPTRAETITFSDAYVEIEATYLVQRSSPLVSIEEVDRPGIRIAVSDRSAYDLYLARSLKHAELRRADGLKAALDLFVSDKLDALAGLRPALNANAENDLSDARVLDGRFTTVQQAIGTNPRNTATPVFLQSFVAEAKKNGLVARLIARHGVEGRLQVAAD